MGTLKHKSLKFIKKIYFIVKYLFIPRTKYYEDGYIQYMSYICSGDMLEKGNIYVWNYVISHLKSGSPILEIGAFSGLSTNIITYFLDKHGKSNDLYAVDYWKLQPDHKKFFHKKFSFQEYNNYIKDSFIRNTKFFNHEKLPSTFHMDSRTFFNKWNKGESVTELFDRNVKLGGKFSFCFVDGDHTYEGVKNDFLNADRVLENEGYLMFDDSSDGSGWDGGNRVMQEIIETKRYSLIMKNPNYLFQKI